MRFWFHYNKPESRKASAPRITLHFGGRCHIVHDLNCMVPTFSRFRKQQPHFVMFGDAKRIDVFSGEALCQ